jgi:hypothetical protein
MRTVEALWENFDIEEFKEELKQLKIEVAAAMKENADPEGEEELLFCVIENLLEGLAPVKDIKKLNSRQQTRLFADICLFLRLSREEGGFDEFEEDLDMFEEADCEEEEAVHEEKHDHKCCGGSHSHANVELGKKPAKQKKC